MPANPRQSMIASFQCFDSISAPLNNSKKFANQLPPSILALDSKTSGLGRFFGSQGIGDMRQIGHFIARFRQLFSCIQSLVAKRFRRENLPPAAGLSSPPLPVRVLGHRPIFHSSGVVERIPSSTDSFGKQHEGRFEIHFLLLEKSEAETGFDQNPRQFCVVRHIAD